MGRDQTLELALQTTLLGVAIAIILALVAALVGPLLIDWGGHRSLFEAEASRLIGVDVRVTGDIDARLLPSPRLTLHAIELGKGGDKVRAKALGIELALGSLMRGEWRASELHLDSPEISLGLDAAGHLQTPNIAVGFNPDGLSIDRLSIENGNVTLTDAANGASVTLDRLWFNGEARSLLGPVKGEGAVRIGGELYPFRISAGRYGEDGALKLHLNVDPVNHPLSVEADGALALAGGEPRFDGTLSLARPVGIALRGATSGAPPSGQPLTQPWRLSGKIKATAAAALMQDVEYQYGSEEQGLKLTGVADFKFGARPRFDGVLSGRQIDLDRVLTPSDGPRPLPATAVRGLAELGAGAFRPTFPIQIGVGIDQVTLGGSIVQNLRGDISTGTQGWNLERFEFRAPGFTQVRLSGQLAVAADGVAFTGPAEIDAGDPKTLAAWLEGRPEPEQGDVRPLNLRGDVTASKEKIAVERLKVTFERKMVAGSLAYRFAAANKPAKLDAALNAPELDIDAVLGFGKALLAGSNFQRPQDMTLAADIGRASLAGVEARDASVRLAIDGAGLRLDRLSIADLGGGRVSGSGRIDTGGAAPRGAISLDFETRKAAALAVLVTKFAPASAASAAGLLDRIGRAKLHATLDVAQDKGAPVTVARLAIDGDLDAMRLRSSLRLTGDWEKPSAADLRFDGTIDAPDGSALTKLVGLDRVFGGPAGSGQLKLLLSGPADGDMEFHFNLTTPAVLAQSIMRGRLSLEDGPRFSGTVLVPRADIGLLRPLSAAGNTPLFFSFSSRAVVAGRALAFDDLNARIGASTLRGRLAFDGQSPRKVSGVLEADSLDAQGMIAAAIGMPAPSHAGSAGWIWSSEPFGSGGFGDYSGEISLKAGRLEVLPQIMAREFRSTLRLGKNEFALADIGGNVAGGRLAGLVSFRSANDGLKARANISIDGADTASLLASGPRPPVAGALTFSADLEGAGLSPAALIGSLHGAGKFGLANGELAGLDPRAFDAVTRAVDQGLAIDAGRIANVVSRALESGQLPVRRMEGTIAVSVGQVRLSNVTTDSKGVALSLGGNLDLTDGLIDARMVLSGASEASGARPDIFVALKGPVASPSRNIDVSALTGWLTLRSVENQAQRLRDAEEEAKRERAIVEEARRLRAAENEARRRAIESEARRLRESETASPDSGLLAPPLPAPLDIKPLPGSARGPPAASVGR